MKEVGYVLHLCIVLPTKFPELFSGANSTRSDVEGKALEVFL